MMQSMSVAHPPDIPPWRERDRDSLVDHDLMNQQVRHAVQRHPDAGPGQLAQAGPPGAAGEQREADQRKTQRKQIVAFESSRRCPMMAAVPTQTRSVHQPSVRPI